MRDEKRIFQCHSNFTDLLSKIYILISYQLWTVCTREKFGAKNRLSFMSHWWKCMYSCYYRHYYFGSNTTNMENKKKIIPKVVRSLITLYVIKTFIILPFLIPSIETSSLLAEHSLCEHIFSTKSMSSQQDWLRYFAIMNTCIFQPQFQIDNDTNMICNTHIHIRTHTPSELLEYKKS